MPADIPTHDGNTIANLAETAARRYGDAVAIIDGGRSLTFTDVDDLTGRFAGGLTALGIGAGDRIVLHLPNGWEWIVAYFAIARIGAVVVPANILLNLEEVCFLVENSQASAVIASPEECREILVRDLPVASLRTIAIGATSSETADFADMLGSPAVPSARVAADAPCTIGYTSGTTGKPKGAVNTHRAIFLSAAWSSTIHVRERGERIVTALPLPHVYGGAVVNSAFIVGMTLIVMRRFDAGEALDLIEKRRATMFEGVPTMYYYMLAQLETAPRDLSSLRRCTVGGQTMPPAKMDAVVQAFGCPLLELWGMTEVAGPATSHSPYLPPRHGSIGLPFPTMEVRIADLQDHNLPAPPGEPGELMIRGPLVMSSYYGDRTNTEDVLGADGWFRTGDIAHIDQDGYIFLVDRKKDMIITAGYNIYPAELEAVIAAHPAVNMVAVGAIADEDKGELAKAFIVLRPGFSVTEEALITFCRARLAPYKLPRRVAFVDALPTTSTGKIMRRALKDIPA